MKRTLIAALTFATTIGVLMVSPSGAQESTKHSANQKTKTADPLIQAVAKSEGVTIEEAVTILRNQHNSISAFQQAEYILGDEFAGAWLDQKGIGTVAITNHDKISLLKSTIKNKSIRIKQVDYSLSELNSAITSIENLSLDLGISNKIEADLDIENNRINASIPDESLIQKSKQYQTTDYINSDQQDLTNEIIDKLKRDIDKMNSRSFDKGTRDHPIIEVKTVSKLTKLTNTNGCSREDCFPFFRGGLEIRNTAHLPHHYGVCTAGYNARGKDDGRFYILTAGHCGNYGDRFQQRAGNRHLGYMETSYDDQRDAGRILVEGPWRPTRWVYATHGFQSIAIVGTAPYSFVKNGIACMSGRTHGYRCGRIEQPRTFIGGKFNFWKASFEAEEGDSGGPVFLPGKPEAPTDVLAYGIISGINEIFWETSTYGPNIRNVEAQLHVNVITR